jgi:pyruvate dehydrogenase E2 component (dihydrolipoamide acetyltransferase)
MATKLTLPSLSPTMEDGVIAKWHVQVGDKVKDGTLLCSVETDKATVDYESSGDEGFVRKIILAEGTQAKVNQLIAVLTDDADEDFEADLAKWLSSENVAPAVAAPAETTAPAPVSPETATPVAAPAATSAPAAPAAPAVDADNSRVKASPLARKLAAEKGISLANIKGTGTGGRIVQSDIENYVPQAPSAPVLAAPSAQTASTAAPARKEVAVAQYGSLAAIVPTHDKPMSTMQKVVGQRLLQSYNSAPAFFVSMKICVDELNAVRAKLNLAPGYKISVNDMIIKGCSLALRKVPLVNATLVGDAIRYNANIDISIAVAIDGGLITPIVKDADHKALGSISAEMKDLAGRAKKGALLPPEFQGGTFTISNLGMFGVSSFTSIINPPQSAILAVAGTEEVLARNEKGEIISKNVMTVTLTADHRVINGAVAAEFVNVLKEVLENPVSLML